MSTRTTNPYVTFAIKVGLFIALMFVIDRSVGLVLQHFFLKMKVGNTANTMYALDKADHDIVILGSSRASHHYVPSVVEDSLGMTVYNAGRDGMSIPYSYGVFKVMLKRHKPRAIIIDLFLEMNVEKTSYERLATLLPHYHRHKELQPILQLRGPYEKIKTLSWMYNYNSVVFTVIANNLLDRTPTNNDGYIPLKSVYNKPPGTLKLPRNLVDSVKMDYFLKLLDEAKENDVKVFVIVSPLYGKFNDETVSVALAKRFCSERKIFFKDYNEASFFTDHREYFSTRSHLNATGSEVFTRMLCSDIKPYLNQPGLVSHQKSY